MKLKQISYCTNIGCKSSTQARSSVFFDIKLRTNPKADIQLKHNIYQGINGDVYCAVQRQSTVTRSGYQDEAATTGTAKTSVTNASTESSSSSSHQSSTNGNNDGEQKTDTTAEALTSRPTVKAEVVTSIMQIGQDEWDACAASGGEGNPFISWAFLYALEESKCVEPDQGWLPHHITVRDESSGKLIGVAPAYLKGHSYGEYVFDHQWAGLADRLGIQYYPKLLCAVPFTPVTGSRLLTHPDVDTLWMQNVLSQCIRQVTDSLKLSSCHINFTTEDEWTLMGGKRDLIINRDQQKEEDAAPAPYLQRVGMQYHWMNNSTQKYETFDQFLGDLKGSARRAIKQERRGILKQGLTTKVFDQDDMKSKKLWDKFYSFYTNTSDRKWGQAYLNRKFFDVLREVMPDRIVLYGAMDPDKDFIAGALNMLGDNCLYGRYWGTCVPNKYKFLHFELCYYMAIDTGISQGLDRVEAGAQGDHKVRRGYLPTKTYSTHYLRNPHMKQLLQSYLPREQREISCEIELLNKEYSPFKRKDAKKK